MNTHDELAARIAITIGDAFDEQEIDSQVSLIATILVFMKLSRDLSINKTRAIEMIKEIWKI